MATRQHLDADLAEVVERSRARAADLGELRPTSGGAIDSPFTDEAREIIAEWKRDGGYDEALAEVAADDPDLAVE